MYGFRSALDLAVSHLQEMRLRRAVQKRGFKVFYTIGEPKDNGFGVPRERWGCLAIVDKRRQVRFLKDLLEFICRSVVSRLKGGLLLTSMLLLGHGAAAEAEVCESLLDLLRLSHGEVMVTVAWPTDSSEVSFSVAGLTCSSSPRDTCCRPSWPLATEAIRDGTAIGVIRSIPCVGL